MTVLDTLWVEAATRSVKLHLLWLVQFGGFLSPGLCFLFELVEMLLGVELKQWNRKYLAIPIISLV